MTPAQLVTRICLFIILCTSALCHPLPLNNNPDRIYTTLALRNHIRKPATQFHPRKSACPPRMAASKPKPKVRLIDQWRLNFPFRPRLITPKSFRQ
ncbi:hypothetical protein BKA70DRAFT_1307623 [Coprinopsis sp. MPI-PUGE-AT-0042]|nr:hypothetical protein BKA70DRAFT_1307623 [Coprinopsis sp. MPI-PUGE-AT-0042]